LWFWAVLHFATSKFTARKTDMKTPAAVIALTAMLFALPAGAQTSTPESLADESTNHLKRYREHNAEWLEARRRSGSEAAAPVEKEETAGKLVIDHKLMAQSEARRQAGLYRRDRHAAVDLTTERAYLYAALCECSKSSYRAKACEALFALILTDLGGRNFGHIMSRKSIDKIHDIID